MIKLLVLPPGINLVLLLFVGILWFKRRTMALFLLIVTFLLTYCLATPFVANKLLQHLESGFQPLDISDNSQLHAEAVVVLGAGRHSQAAEFSGEDAPSALGLERMLYAAHLVKQLQLPLAAAGGAVFDPEMESEASIMGRYFLEYFHIITRWQEGGSRNTWENAINSGREFGNQVSTILLVTHAWHMKRAKACFEKAGFTVIPAPTRFTSDSLPVALSFIPSASALSKSTYALHEYIGILWYRLVYF
ncbi:YdcF family protein [Endozoicomonas sp. SM1973]|uniref:YdcF family protein n=1 Tax=Spartinivicinus marinus TaxID=2994442 RepID=A0A853I3D6_9GAMM|nr:YdcF family protein [Spartinivicinus marinus]MCX4026003.1 YdcF family protein [Spartinivicinus marinus]NYZ67903.1 YdcF family protein [Spartinivicinus marinus]